MPGGLFYRGATGIKKGSQEIPEDFLAAGCKG